MQRRCLTALCFYQALLLVSPASATTTLLLDATSDSSSIFYEYFSEGFFRMDLFATDFPTHQNFHNINDPSIQYGQTFDGFPNDENFRFGRLEYDESAVTGGTGDAPITAVTFGVSADPFDPTYENWRRFSATTAVNNFSGTVSLVAGAPVGIDLDIDYTVTISNPLGATTSGDYPGTFNVIGTEFTLQAEGSEMFETVFGPADLHLEWDFTGEFANFNVLDMADPPGDYNRDGEVDEEDYDLWVDTFGGSVPRYSGADANGVGQINAASYPVWRDHYAPSANEATAVPEPTSLAILAIIALVAVSIFRTRR